ncbi:hypothetical protein H5410_057354 [Solanum commersonii]|uniref:Uncharacterized protein n=1 Tax=Solanum commersonii TaxID=4109 RepID=A0A9J5WPX5_SOLCO|nr:hypothetical protein H5410_057354 [Solanum commersonii]
MEEQGLEFLQFAGSIVSRYSRSLSILLPDCGIHILQ